MKWEENLRRVAKGVVVNKGVSVKYDGIRLPRFISEFLLSEFMLRHGDHEEAVRKMSEYIDDNIPQPGHSAEWHNRLRSGEYCQLIDNIRVTVHMERNDAQPLVRIPSIGLDKAQIEPNLLLEHPRLLREGIWGKATLYAHDGSVWLVDLKPFQVSEISFQDYVAIRKDFSSSEWEEILISTIGLAPESFVDSRKRLSLISRLLPLVQGQTFLIEMGPPGTGKTFILDKLSTRSFVISGSKISPAQLFYDIKTRTDGLLRQYSALMFDEIDKVKDNELSEEVVNKLLKYMESGTFDRGGREFQSDTSIIIVGNLPPGGHINGPVLRNLPNKLIHEAFLDRINGILPGWELAPVMHSSASLTKTWGFSADYFSEIMEYLRQLDWLPEFRHRIDFENCSIRDEKSIMRTVVGLAKLLYPDKQIGDEALHGILDFALDIRQRLIEESALLHGIRSRRISARLRKA